MCTCLMLDVLFVLTDLFFDKAYLLQISMLPYSVATAWFQSSLYSSVFALIGCALCELVGHHLKQDSNGE